MNYRQRKCAICRTKFQPEREKQKTCSPECAEVFARQLREKKERIELRAAINKVRPFKFHLKKLERAFNRYIVLRDANLPCISCGRYYDVEEFHAGHYKTVGAHAELRFDEKNVHKQCSQCNTYLRGNLINYRLGLIQRYGEEYPKYLEGYHPPKHYTVDQLTEMYEHYKAEAKRLENEMKEAA